MPTTTLFTRNGRRLMKVSSHRIPDDIDSGRYLLLRGYNEAGDPVAWRLVPETSQYSPFQKFRDENPEVSGSIDIDPVVYSEPDL